MKTIGEIIKVNRKKMKLIQAQLAIFAKVSTKFISELENNNKTIHLDKIYEVLSVFDLTLSIVSKKEFEIE